MDFRRLSPNPWERSAGGLYSFGFFLQFGGFQEVVEFAAEIRTKAVHTDEPRLVRRLRAFLQDQKVAHSETAAGAGCRLLGTEGLRHTAFFRLHLCLLHSHFSGIRPPAPDRKSPAQDRPRAGAGPWVFLRRAGAGSPGSPACAVR